KFAPQTQHVTSACRSPIFSRERVSHLHAIREAPLSTASLAFPAASGHSLSFPPVRRTRTALDRAGSKTIAAHRTQQTTASHSMTGSGDGAHGGLCQFRRRIESLLPHRLSKGSTPWPWSPLLFQLVPSGASWRR